MTIILNKHSRIDVLLELIKYVLKNYSCLIAGLTEITVSKDLHKPYEYTAKLICGVLVAAENLAYVKYA